MEKKGVILGERKKSIYCPLLVSSLHYKKRGRKWMNGLDLKRNAYVTVWPGGRNSRDIRSINRFFPDRMRRSKSHLP